MILKCFRIFISWKPSPVYSHQTVFRSVDAEFSQKNKYLFFVPFLCLFCFDFSNEIHSLTKTPLSIVLQVKKNHVPQF